MPITVRVTAILTETWSENGVLEMIIDQLVFGLVRVSLLISFVL